MDEDVISTDVSSKVDYSLNKEKVGAVYWYKNGENGGAQLVDYGDVLSNKSQYDLNHPYEVKFFGRDYKMKGKSRVLS